LIPSRTWLKGPFTINHVGQKCFVQHKFAQNMIPFSLPRGCTILVEFCAPVFVSHILNMTSEVCVAIILALACNPEKAKKRCFYINNWIPIDTCCATSPLTMQTSCATAVLHKKYQNSSDFMQQIMQIVNQHHTRSNSCTTRNVAQHD
jgi:hypothetical protein